MMSHLFYIILLCCLARKSRGGKSHTKPAHHRPNDPLQVYGVELQEYKDLFHHPLRPSHGSHSTRGTLKPRVLLQGVKNTSKSCFILKINRHTNHHTLNRVAEFLEKIGAEVEGSIKDLLKVHMVCFNGGGGSSTDTPLSLLKSIKCVEKVEMDQQLTIEQWANDRIAPKMMHKSSRLGDHSKSNNSHVSVYVVDTGIWVKHSEFNGTAKIGYSLFNNRFGDDCNGHGTQVASLIGGKSLGIAPGVRLIGVQAMDCDGSGTVSNMLKALDWIKVNAVKPAIVNMSFNGAKSDILDDAINALIDFGITVVAAAGNKGCDACKMSPNDSNKVIIVGASDKEDRRATFSNYGKCITLFAPGCNIVAASVPFTPKSSFSPEQFVDKMSIRVSQSHPQDRFVMTSGTSFAAPFVSGSIALLLSKNATLTPCELRERLLNGSQWNALQNDTLNNSPNLLLQLPCPC